MSNTSEKKINDSTLALLTQIEAEMSIIESESDTDKSHKSMAKTDSSPDINLKKRILVIDDDSTMLKSIKWQLDEHYHVSTAVSGAVARRFFEKHTADLILLDYQMPYEDGAAFFKYLRATKTTKDIPVIFLTSVNDSDKIADVLALKPQGYLLKPVDHETLLSKVKATIG